MSVVQKIKPMPVTESTIQDVLAEWCEAKKHELIIPNCGTVFGWEADLASITKSGMAHEFEIKVSRGDWLREVRAKGAAKLRRHQELGKASEVAAERMGRGYKGPPLPPNYWWVVAPKGVVREGELPAYAGLLEVRHGSTTGRIRFSPIKPAPRLHCQRVVSERIMSISRGLCIRYWNQRRNLTIRDDPPEAVKE